MFKRCLILILSVVFVISGCQNKEEHTPTTDNSIAKVESVSLADGSVGVSVETGLIDVIYDLPIAMADESKIVMNDVSVTASIANKRLRIEFSGLEYGKEYTLNVATGAVKTKSSEISCDAFSLSFTTEEEVLPPAPPYTPGEPGNYSASLVTENPIPNARRVYEYLLSIYGEKTLSGAIAKVNWNREEIDWIYKWTQKEPAMATFDYIHLQFSPANWIDYGDITPVKEWFDKGGIVSACWHWNVPNVEGGSEVTCTPGDGKKNSSGTWTTTFRPSNILVEGTWEHEVAHADLEKIADYILLLQEQGIPVVWRPLHEAAGNTFTQWKSGAWFWWGRDGGEAYVNLWRYMFDYFKGKGIRNLIWVWTTQTSMIGDSDYEFYPGDDYVDIVGRDIYNNTNSSDIASQFKTITEMVPNKMVTLSEHGGVSDMESQWNAGAKWLYFMPWYDYGNDGTENYNHSHASISWWRQSFESDAVIDLSELPADLYE